MNTLQNKATTDKKGWSFRKKSSGHRVLSNTVNVITETPSSDDKKSSEPVLINSEPPVSFPESEKTSANQCTEEFSRVSTSNTKDNIHNTVSNLVTKADEDEDDIKSDSSFDESSIIVIQTAIRSFLVCICSPSFFLFLLLLSFNTPFNLNKILINFYLGSKRSEED